MHQWGNPQTQPGQQDWTESEGSPEWQYRMGSLLPEDWDQDESEEGIVEDDDDGPGQSEAQAVSEVEAGGEDLEAEPPNRSLGHHDLSERLLSVAPSD